MKKLFLSFLFKLLKSESNFVLKKFNPEIIAITGSIAKTSTKEAVWIVLKEKFGDNLWKSHGNLNTKYGIPLAILGFRRSPRLWEWPFFVLCGFWRSRFIKKYPKILILEFAADKPGDFDDLLSYIQPKIGVITLIGPAHLEFFQSVERIFQEKIKILKKLPQNGYAIINKNDLRADLMAQATEAKVIYYYGDNFEIANKAAEAIGKIYHLRQDKIIKALNSLKPTAGRMNLLIGINGCKIIDDTYNANPLSVSAALDYLEKIASAQGRKIAILGEMLELGDYTKKGHLEVAEKARKIADILILVGNNFKFIKKRDYWFENSEYASLKIQELISPALNDTILIKGSRKTKMEKVVERLKIPHQSDRRQ
jgi:UDP-N-acetylmuramoyl-tripeptide--D-alanyl-D-alanine ligase